MLTRLDIRDFAVVAHAELEAGPGMTVISGETGAGKSLLVDALGLLCGQRADSGMIRHGAERAELQAEFDLRDAPLARQWLADAELDEADQCQLRRVLRADGGSRAWINGRSVTAAQLQALSGLLVEIHGQHAHQALLSRTAQLSWLDAYGRHLQALDAVRVLAGDWRALRDERQRLVDQGEVRDRIAYLEHQWAELQLHDLSADALEQLQQAHRRQAHAASLIQSCAQAAQVLGDGGPEGLESRLQRTRSALSAGAEHEPRLLEVDALLDAAAIQLQEAASLLDRLQSDLDVDPARYQVLDEQLAELHALARKHRIPIADLASRRDALAAELETLRNADARLADIDAGLDRTATEWRQAAAALTAARRRAAAAMRDTVTPLIAELGMAGGVFEVELHMTEHGDPDPSGAERVEFLVSANPGQPPRALRKVASGGELARISLAIEVAALGLDAVPTMVFDEVDTGIGGAVAQIVGRKLRALGRARQVLCVTHLPQVAAHGHVHYRVSKAAKQGLTRSAITLLDERARVDEIARMLGGTEIGKEARAAAKALLREAAADDAAST